MTFAGIRDLAYCSSYSIRSPKRYRSVCTVVYAMYGMVRYSTVRYIYCTDDGSCSLQGKERRATTKPQRTEFKSEYGTGPAVHVAQLAVSFSSPPESVHLYIMLALPRVVLSSQVRSLCRFKSSVAVAATAAYDQTVETFPSIVIGPNKSIVPQGSFAEAQAQVRMHACALFSPS